MHITTLTSFSLAAVSGLAWAQDLSVTPVTGILGNATNVTNEVTGGTYIATLDNAANTDIRGAVQIQTDPSGTGVNIQVTMSGFPADGGPFLYHIHNYPITDDGNCTTAGSHVDPYERGEVPNCDPTLPMTCQVGDLAGKHGSIAGPSFSANYFDSYISTMPGSGAFAGNRSLVVHFANKTIITCGNFTTLDDGTANQSNTTALLATMSLTAAPTASSSTTGSSTIGTQTVVAASAATTSSSSTSATPLASTGGATTLAFNAAALLVGALAFLV